MKLACVAGILHNRESIIARSLASVQAKSPRWIIASYYIDA
jgi:hypothetical protein